MVVIATLDGAEKTPWHCTLCGIHCGVTLLLSVMINFCIFWKVPNNKYNQVLAFGNLWGHTGRKKAANNLQMMAHCTLMASPPGVGALSKVAKNQARCRVLSCRAKHCLAQH